MKHNYLFLFLVTATLASAQLTLTKATHEPQAGTSYTTTMYDTTTALPRNTGQNQTWNFSSIVKLSSTDSQTYLATSSTPSVANYPGTTLGGTDGNGNYAYYKSNTSPSNFEMLGVETFLGAIKFDDPIVLMAYPMSFGTTSTDTYSGTGTGFFSGTTSGTVVITGTGHGTLLLPGGVILSNVLQVRTVQTESVGSSMEVTVDDQYFHASSRYPVLTISTDQASGEASVELNSTFIVGLKERTNLTDLNIGPNPCKDAFYITLNRPTVSEVLLQITDLQGKTIRQLQINATVLSTRISTEGISPGLYLLKLSAEDQSTVEKLIIE